MARKSLSTKNPKAAPGKKGIRIDNRIALGRAITLVESNNEGDRVVAGILIENLEPPATPSIRIGITGAPGVGKSTFIDAFGKYITSLGKKVAVLTIDPSSQKTKGSILGDKTRMEELSKDPSAFIRPSATGTATGGVATATRESILLCEAAGYEVIIVETVGVGQSEVAVRGVVDFFLLLMLAGSGDELQGIKKGIMEMADGMAITKADGDNTGSAKKAQADFQHALHLFQAQESGFVPKVLTTSALSKTGIAETWAMVESFCQHTRKNGYFKIQRDRQQLLWFHALLDTWIKNKILKKSKGGIAALEKRILTHGLTPRQAAKEVMKKFKV